MFYKYFAQVSKLLDTALDYILLSQESVASSLRLVQVFTDVASYAASDSGQTILVKMYQYLLSRRYYAKVRQLVDTRIPAGLLGTVRELRYFEFLYLDNCHPLEVLASNLLKPVR